MPGLMLPPWCVGRNNASVELLFEVFMEILTINGAEREIRLRLLSDTARRHLHRKHHDNGSTGVERVRFGL